MRKLISYLYHRFCTPKSIDSVYLAFHRDFTRVLTENEVHQRNIAVFNFIQSGWFKQIFNEHLKERVEALFNICETQKHRDYVSSVIKELLKFEETFNSKGLRPEGKADFDKHNL